MAVWRQEPDVTPAVVGMNGAVLDAARRAPASLGRQPPPPQFAATNRDLSGLHVPYSQTGHTNVRPLSVM